MHDQRTQITRTDFNISKGSVSLEMVPARKKVHVNVRQKMHALFKNNKCNVGYLRKLLEGAS